MTNPNLDLVCSLRYTWHRFLGWYLLNSRHPTELRCRLIPRRNCRIVSGHLQHILGSDICLLPWRRYEAPGNSLLPAYISDWLFSKSWRLARMFLANIPWPMTVTGETKTFNILNKLSTKLSRIFVASSSKMGLNHSLTIVLYFWPQSNLNLNLLLLLRDHCNRAGQKIRSHAGDISDGVIMVF